MIRPAAAGPRRAALLPALIVGLSALALYCATLMPDVALWDTAEFQTVGTVLGIAHPTGYPAYTLLAWLASIVFEPLGNPALRANLLSALLGAGAAAVVAGTVATLTRRPIIGVAAGGALALAVEVWRVSLHADPHALHLFLVALILALLVGWAERIAAGQPADRWLVLAAITFGVALANHGLTFLLAPPIALFLLIADPGLIRRPRVVIGCALGLVLTTVALYAYLPLRSAMNPPLDYANPQTWEGFRYLVFAEQFRGEFQAPPDPLSGLGFVARLSLLDLGVLAPAAVLGTVWSVGRRAALVVLLAGWLIVGWLFALVYVNADIGRYYLVPLLATAVLGGLGLGALWDWLARWREWVAPGRAMVIALIGGTLLLLQVPLAVAWRGSIPDESRQTVAREWLTALVDRLPPDAVVVSWWGYSTTLWYGQFAEGLRPDVTVIDDSTIVQRGLGSASAVIDSYLGQRPVFLIRLSSDLPAFQRRYLLSLVPGVSGGDVYRVEERLATAGREPIIGRWP